MNVRGLEFGEPPSSWGRCMCVTVLRTKKRTLLQAEQGAKEEKCEPWPTK